MQQYYTIQFENHFSIYHRRHHHDHHMKYTSWSAPTAAILLLRSELYHMYGSSLPQNLAAMSSYNHQNGQSTFLLWLIHVSHHQLFILSSTAAPLLNSHFQSNDLHMLSTFSARKAQYATFFGANWKQYLAIVKLFGTKFSELT